MIMMMNNFRMALLCLTLCGLVLMSHYHIVLLDMSRPEWIPQAIDLVVVYTEDDDCSRWMHAFPGRTILLVGYQQTNKSPHNCFHVTRQNGSIDHLKFQAQHILVVDGNQGPEFHAQDSALTVHRTSIIYEQDKNPMYEGNGSVDSLKGVERYYTYEDLRSAILAATVSVPRSAQCSLGYPSMILAPGVYTLTPRSYVALESGTSWIAPFFSDYHSTKNESIALNLIAQKLLWMNGYVLETRTMCANVSDNTVMSDIKGYAKEVIETLDKLNCESIGFNECLMKIVNDTVWGKYLSRSKLDELKQWTEALRGRQLEDPQNIYGKPSLYHSKADIMSYISGKENTSMTTWQVIANAYGEKVIGRNAAERTRLRSSTCKPRVSPSNTPWKQWADTLLIVVFNTPNYKSLPYYETLYRPLFPNIVYCGPIFPKVGESTLSNFSFQFITFGETPKWLNAGSLHYKCLIQATRLGYNVSGYLQTADDILLMAHRLQHFNLSKVWSFRLDNMIRTNYKNLTICDGPHCYKENITFWHTFNRSTISALSEIQKLSSSSAVMKKCASNIETLFGGRDWSLRILSDILYVPKRLIHEVTDVLSIFARNEVFLEIAIPTTIHCVTPQSEIDPLYTHFHNVHRVPGKSKLQYSPETAEPADPSAVLMSHRVYSGGRDKPWKHITPELMTGASFYHPYKMGYASVNNEYVRFFCEIASFLDDPKGNMPAFLMKAPVSKAKPKPKPKK